MNDQDWSREDHALHMDRFMRKVAADCRADPEVRAELEADPRAFLAGRGLNLPAGPDVKVSANTPAVLHLVLAQDPNAALADQNLERVAGGAAELPPTQSVEGYTGVAFWPGAYIIPRT